MKYTRDRRITCLLALAALIPSSIVGPAWGGTYNNNFNADPSDTVVSYGHTQWMPSGGVNGTGFMSLTEAENSMTGSFIIDDLDNGALIGGFVATFKLRIGGGSGNPADGFSFNWGTDIANAAFGEDGSGTGLVVAFDIYDNGGGEAPSIDIRAGGVVVQQHFLPKADIMTGDPFEEVRIELRDSKLNLSYKGQTIFTNLVVVLPPMSAARFAFGARTGGENATHWVDDLSLQTFAPSNPTLAGIRPNGKGFWISLQDAPNAAVDASSVTATVNGAAVVGTATKTGEKTTYVYNSSSLLPVGSTNTVVLSYRYGSPAKTGSTDPLVLVVPAYTVIPSSAAMPAANVDKTKRGFLWRIHQAEADGTLATSNQRAEDQLAGLQGDNVADPNWPGAAEAVASPANPSTAPIEFKIPGVINLSQAEGSEFGNAKPDLQMPGLPGLNGGTDNAAAEILTVLEFPQPGIYWMIVNSDDGFKTTAGKDPRDVSSLILGVFDAGRGAADTSFQFYVETAGLYGFRTLWEEGGGDANIEWLTEFPDGSKVLINDTASNAIKAYQFPTAKLPAFVGSARPGAGVSLVNRPATVEAILMDPTGQVSASSVTLKLNGQAAPVTATKTGTQIRIVHTVSGDLLALTPYTAELTYSDSNGAHSTSWNFTTGPLSSKVFVIEAEDFDYDGGQFNPQKGAEGLDVDVMPYLGGAYDGLGAIEGVDYNNGDAAADGNIYRAEMDENGENEVAMSQVDAGAPGNGKGGLTPIASNNRGNYTTTRNYSIGWVGAGDWENFTRTFPNNGSGNWWNVYAGLSHGETADGNLSATLSKVTEGVGTADQTLEQLGTFNAPGSGGWGNNNLVPMKTTSGGLATVKLTGQNTVRMTHTSADFDFLIFSAATPPPPYLAGAPQDSCKRNEVIMDWTLNDAASKVNTSSIKVFFDDQDVTSKTTAVKTATGATVHLDLSSTTFAAGEHRWKLTFSDDSTPAQTVSAEGVCVVIPYPAQTVFVIEGEDFNYSSDDVTGGKSNPQKGISGLDVDVMPYSGGAYEGLSAVEGVDYNNSDALDSDLYRSEKDENGENEVNIAESNGNRFSNDRGAFELPNNWRVGWVASGDWANYTRTFPSADYNVWAAMSYDGRAAGQLTASLDMVTSDPSKPNQTVERLGTFNAPGSGGWGRNELVPLKDSGGEILIVPMAGVKTVRFNMNSGDLDYLVFVPVTSTDQSKFTSTTRAANGAVVVQWTGNGTLQTAASVQGPWVDVAGASSPYTVSPTQQALFIRLIKR